MTRFPALLTVAAGAMLMASGCADSAPSALGASSPVVSGPSAGTPTPQPSAAGVTPDQVCALVDMAQMSRITGFTIVSTRPATSGNVAVCHYDGKAADGFVSAKVILEFQPDGKAGFDHIKANGGQLIPGIGVSAVYHRAGGQLSVELGGTAVMHVFIMDLRANHNDHKGAAVQIAQIAVPRLPQG